jgi:urease accessory protein
MSNTSTKRLLFTTLALLAAGPALAHHPMGGVTPATFMQGLLSGLAHPVIGLDHLAAVIAVGCLAAVHRAGVGLVAGFVLAMMVGAAMHVRGVNVPAGELVLAACVIALGVAIQLRATLGTAVLAALFAIAGLLSGYALGEAITGAEPTPLYAYFTGLAIVHIAIGLAAMALARRYAMRPYAGVALNIRLIGAAVIGIGLAGFISQTVMGS